MADNTKIWPIFRWANWGLSDDLFTGIRNSFYFSNNMEIRQDAKSIYPMWVPAYADANKWADIWDGSSGYLRAAPVCILYSSYQWGFLIFLQRAIYKHTTAWVTTLLCTLTEDICDAELFGWYIYISTRTHVYYKTENTTTDWEDMKNSTNETQINYGRCSQTLTSNGWHPLYWSDTILCVWDTNKVRKITKEVPNTLQEWFTIQNDYYVRFINELWWFLRIVATDAFFWSEVFLWDKISTYPGETIPMEWYDIIWSCIYNWYQYLLSDKWLGLLNWYQYYILKKAEWNVDSTSKNNMCVYNDKLYFIANDWVYIYWAKNKNYADVLWLWHKVEDWYSLWAICSSTKWLVVSRSWLLWAWWEEIPVRIGIDSWIATTWELQTMAYFWTSMSEIKQSMYLRVGYHIPKEWSNTWDIHIYYRTEADAVNDDIDSWAWHPVQPKDEWLFATWDMRSPFATTLKLNCRFQWIQFKFVVNNCVYTSWVDTLTKDTNLYSADLYYNVMLD